MPGITYPYEIRGTVGAAIVDPVGNEGAESNDTSFDTNQQAAVGRPRALRLVRRDGRRVDSVPNAGDDSTDDELGLGAVSRNRRNLDDHTDDHDDTAHSDRSSAASLVSIHQLDDRTEQTTDFVDTSHETLPCRVISGVGKCIVEGGRGDDAAHDTLIVAEEQETAGGHGRNGKAQPAAGETHVVRDAMLVVLVYRAENHLDGALPPGQS